MPRSRAKEPPALSQRIIRLLSDYEDRFSLEGDLREAYYHRLHSHGQRRARHWYRMQVMKSSLSYIHLMVRGNVAMLHNYVTVAVRNIKRQKGYAFITIAGLALGMASCIAIVSYVLYELSYDRFNENAGRIYRLCFNGSVAGNSLTVPFVNSPTAPALIEEYPEVQNAVRLYDDSPMPVQYKERIFNEEKVVYADNSLFDIFSLEMLRGDAVTPLVNSYTAVLTEETASKYFGEEDPLHKIIKIDNDDFTVTGVVGKPPRNSQLDFNVLCSFETLYAGNRARMEGWVPFDYLTYLLLSEGVDHKELEAKFPAFIERHMGELIKALGGELEYFLQPLTSIHLYSHLQYDNPDNGDIKYVYIFSAIAIFVVLIACINFMNLATARSENRANEIGIRKVIGSHRNQLMRQFLVESLIYSVISLALALVLVQIFLPGLRTISGKELGLSYRAFPWFIPGFFGLAFFVGLAAGSYPALFLSAFRPVQVLRGHMCSVTRNIRFRNILVVCQFSISIILIINTVVLMSQLGYIRNKSLGFNKENILIMNLGEEIDTQSLPSLKAELKRFSGIEHVTVSSEALSNVLSTNAYIPEGYSDEQSILVQYVAVDEEFMETMGMEIVAGRNFSEEISTDKNQAMIINEAAVEKLGWENPVGKTIKQIVGTRLSERITMTVIGVVRNFHSRSLHHRIDPLFIVQNPDEINRLVVRIKAGSTPDAIEFLRGKWRSINADSPFEFTFLDDSIAQQYEGEKRLSVLFSYFAVFAIFIACLGLYGLASCISEKRTKEIGVRKVLGASLSSIALNLSKEFIIWVLLANVIAWPVAYFFMQYWLSNFAYRLSIHIGFFLCATALSLLIALLTVSYHSLRAATANPVDALKYE